MCSPRSTGRQWRKSSYSGAQDQNCVEVAHATRSVAVRDSKDPDGPVLTFDLPTFGAFVLRAKGNRLG